MRIAIKDIQTSEDGEAYQVVFSTPFGEGIGLWQWREPPNTALEYEVELEIENVLHWGVDIVPVTENVESIRYENDKVSLQGSLDGVGLDGMAFLRLGSSQTMLETTGEPPAPGTFVAVLAQDVQVFPHDYYDPDDDLVVRVKESAPGMLYRPASSQPGSHIIEDILLHQAEDVFDINSYKEILERGRQLKKKSWRTMEIMRSYPKQERRKLPESSEYREISNQFDELAQEFRTRLPLHMLAICPYCGSKVLQPFDSFSLAGLYSDFEVTEIYMGGPEWFSRTGPGGNCAHALFTTLFINLNNLIPDDLPAWLFGLGRLGNRALPLDSSPSVVVWPLIARRTSAVIHALPIGRLDDPRLIHRYTAYFVTYFADDGSNLLSDEKMWVSGSWAIPATGGVYIDFDLHRWIEVERLFWVNPTNMHELSRSPISAFPYGNIEPKGWYFIHKGGRVEGPNPNDPKSIWYGNMPPHDDSFSRTIES